MMPDPLVPWGKIEPFHPLACHMMDVGVTARAILQTNAFFRARETLSISMGHMNGDFDDWIAFLAGLHDVGKCNADFQQKVSKAIWVVDALKETGLPFKTRANSGFRHEALGAGWVLDYLLELGWGRGPASIVASAIRGHHGNFQSSAVEDASLAKPWNAWRVSIVSMMDSFFPRNCWKPEVFPSSSVAGIVFSGLLVMADWIASNENFFPRTSIATIAANGIEWYFDVVSRNASIVSSMIFGNVPSWMKGFTSFRDAWPAFDCITPVQSIASMEVTTGAGPGLAMIEAPTGSGKTEAAIYIASRWMERTGASGFYLALPTQATSNQMYIRIKEFLNGGGRDSSTVKLVHGMAWIVDRNIVDGSGMEIHGEGKDADQVSDWFNPRKRSLLSPVAVGTVDQLLIMALRAKYGQARFAGVSTKIIIVDEVHACDAYMSRIMVTFLKWASAMRVPVILVSATLPASMKESLARAYTIDGVLEKPDACEERYPCITVVNSEGKRNSFGLDYVIPSKDLGIVLHGGLIGDPVKISALAAGIAGEGKCVCIITNTVRSAISIYREVKKLGNASMLYHSRFIASKRMEIEQDVVKFFGKDPSSRPRDGFILVATQVVEQSLDVDFDEMIIEVAPIDLVIQRAGRLHRHERPGRPGGSSPVLHVLVPGKNSKLRDLRAVTGNGKVYSQLLVAITIDYLQKIPVVGGRMVMAMPDLTREAVSSVYSVASGDAPLPAMDGYDVEGMMHAHLDDESGDRSDASVYLLPDPSVKRFTIGWQPALSADEDKDSKSYMAVKTRNGDDQETLLVFDGKEHESTLRGKKKPPVDVLADIYGHLVKVPSYWLKGVDVQEETPRWLGFARIVRMENGKQAFESANGYTIVLENKEDEGVVKTATKVIR